MPVLTEGISVVVPVATIEAKYPGGLSAYAANCSNNTFCADETLTRVGFMTPSDAKSFVELLENHGFIVHDGEKFVDLAVVDQREGPTDSCSWLRWGRNAQGVAAAWLGETPPKGLATPAGWEYEGSLSEKSGFVRTEEIPTRLQLLRTEGNVDVYLDAQTGKEVFVGRTKS